MRKYAALDVSMEQTAICVVEEDGRKVVEGYASEEGRLVKVDARIDYRSYGHHYDQE